MYNSRMVDRDAEMTRSSGLHWDAQDEPVETWLDMAAALTPIAMA